jgi:hypothetical protein
VKCQLSHLDPQLKNNGEHYILDKRPPPTKNQRHQVRGRTPGPRQDEKSQVRNLNLNPGVMKDTDLESREHQQDYMKYLSRETISLKQGMIREAKQKT